MDGVDDEDGSRKDDAEVLGSDGRDERKAEDEDDCEEPEAWGKSQGSQDQEDGSEYGMGWEEERRWRRGQRKSGGMSDSRGRP